MIKDIAQATLNHLKQVHSSFSNRQQRRKSGVAGGPSGRRASTFSGISPSQNTIYSPLTSKGLRIDPALPVIDPNMESIYNDFQRLTRSIDGRKESDASESDYIPGRLSPNAASNKNMVEMISFEEGITMQMVSPQKEALETVNEEAEDSLEDTRDSGRSEQSPSEVDSDNLLKKSQGLFRRAVHKVAKRLNVQQGAELRSSDAEEATSHDELDDLEPRRASEILQCKQS
jgi:hypothetical protein